MFTMKSIEFTGLNILDINNFVSDNYRDLSVFDFIPNKQFKLGKNRSSYTTVSINHILFKFQSEQDIENITIRKIREMKKRLETL